MTTPIRDAATVVLLRDGATGLEAWLLTRVRQLAFAGGMSVFPGGRVDPGDADVPWSGLPAERFAAAFGCTVDLARSLVVAAVRETFEETGVLLSAPPAALEPSVRAAVESGAMPFAGLLRSSGLAVDADLVRPWAHWITPEGETRRYDTRFFVAALPAGATAAAGTSEASRSEWVPVATALRQSEEGARGLLPPTLITLRSLLPFGTVSEVLDASAGRSFEPIAPRLLPDTDPPAVELPDGTVVAFPTGRPA